MAKSFPLKVSFLEWLVTQCHRDDLVGELARACVLSPSSNPDPDIANRLKKLKQEAKWGDSFTASRNDFENWKKKWENRKRSRKIPDFFETPAFEEFNRESFRIHREHPGVSAEQYLSLRHSVLSKGLTDKKLIYLDTRHWIHIRDVVRGKANAKTEHAAMFALLHQLRTNNKILCPISFPLFCELMQQEKSDRLETARLMDFFSDGVCLQKPEYVLLIEFREFHYKAVFGDSAPTFEKWLWTKVGYIFGEMFPTHRAFDEATNNLIQKTSIDLFWHLPLEHFAEEEFPVGIMLGAERAYAAATNGDARWYRENKIPFKDIYAREKAHVFRRIIPEVKAIAAETFKQFPNECSSYAKRADLTPYSRMNFPSLQVLAGANAALLIQKKKFKHNDMLDFQHAALAIPYCDALYCDREMAQTLRNKPLEFEKAYGTKILSESDEILAHLQSL